MLKLLLFFIYSKVFSVAETLQRQGERCLHYQRFIMQINLNKDSSSMKTIQL